METTKISEKARIEQLSQEIKNELIRPVAVMEVCGSHTMAMAKHAIKSFLPPELRIISGPGCPVCVTSSSDIQLAIDLARKEKFIIATFGDMLKVPVEGDSLQNYSNVKIIYSPLESISLAKQYPDHQIVLIGIGFETTAPLIATTIFKAYEEKLDNFSVIPMHKLVPPALDAIFEDGTVKIDALLLPGHVSVITGWKYFEFIEKYPMAGVISGFDAIDLMESLLILVKMVQKGEFGVVNHYERLVSAHGNLKAKEMIEEVYEFDTTSWREIGNIPDSGFKLRAKYQHLDARVRFKLIPHEIPSPPGCLCGSILMGKAAPTDCKLFAKACTPANPIGPCMVSSEGTCAAYFKYQLPRS